MKVISVLLICVGLFLISRLYFLQVINGEELTMKADRQYVRPNQSVFDRGAIFFNTKDGERIPAATLKTGYIIFINPTRIDDPENVYLTLRNYINISKEDFMEKASKEDDPYEEIADKVDKDTADKIISLHIDGVQASKERWRYYPGGEMAAQTLGIIAYSGDELAGRYGLERSYEQTLSRKEGNVYVNFFAEIFSNLRDVVTYSEDKEGDVITTIEPNVQAFLEQKLQETLVAYDAQEVGGIVIDPKTGKVTALGSLPSFDPNNFSGESLSIFVNPLVENVYEMGSIMKPLTVAAGLDAGVITPETTYDDKGYLVLNGSRIENYDGKGRGVVPMQEILNQSLNTGVSFIASKLGNDVFSEYMFKYGLGEASGIDLPNDTKGLTDNLNSPRDIEHATASFGQGIAVTPMTMVRALSVLANGGTLIQPHIVEEIDYEKGFAYTPEYKEGERVIKKSTSEEISRMLTKVVDDALLGGEVALDNYSVAAKTGTAQVASAEGGYYEDKYLHTFFGYFPSYNARFLTLLYVKFPQGERYASHTLTEPFMDITQFLINYYDIAPDR